MAEAAFVLVVLLVGLAAPLVLYSLVRAEHDRREEERGRSERSERDLGTERGA